MYEICNFNKREKKDKLGAKLKCDTKEDLEAWILQYASDLGATNIPTETKQVLVPPSPTFTYQSVTVSHPPRISNFSGTEKVDVSYEQWRYEVSCLLKEKLSPEIKANVVHRSLRREAGKVAVRLGSDASVTTLLHKLDSIYGIIERKETILEEFYSAHQRQGETVSAWGCRLEDILNKGIQKGQILMTSSQTMLKDKFWTGMQ